MENSMKDNYYAADYIRRVIANDKIEQPDTTQAGRYNEPLASLYEVHSIGGAKMALITWSSTIRKVYPDLGRMFETMRHVYLSTDLGKIPRMHYLIPDYAVYEGSFNVLAGPRGIGKSFVSLDLAKQVGRTERVLYIAAEGASVYQDRSLAWHHKNKHEDNKNVLFYGKEVESGDSHRFNEFVRLVVDSWKPVLIVVDTVARCMTGMDENSSSDMKLFVSRWDALRERGCALLFLHHTNKRGFIRGSGVLDDAADSVLVLSKPVENGLVLRNDFEGGGKNRASKEAAPLYFQIKSQEVPGYPQDDLPGVIHRCTREVVYLNEVGEELSTNQRDILSAISEAGSLTVKEIQEATKIPSTTIYNNIKGLMDSECVKKATTFYEATEKGKRLLENVKHNED